MAALSIGYGSTEEGHLTKKKKKKANPQGRNSWVGKKVRNKIRFVLLQNFK